MYYIFYLFICALSHNWIHSEGGVKSRCGQACPMFPAPPRAGPRKPHLQVGPDQEFLLEWVTGHATSRYYFVVLKADYEDKLSEHTRTVLDKYISDAPDSAKTKFSGERWQRFHISCSHPTPATGGNTQPWKAFDDCSTGTYNDGTLYEGIIEPDHDLYIERPANWTEKNWNNLSPKTQFRFSELQRANDARVEYTHPDYPWIEAVHRFIVAEDAQASEWDIARFKIAARDANGEFRSGEYLIHMVWGGYRDVVDVDIFPEETSDPYGITGEAEWVRTDHCIYPYYEQRTNQCYYFQRDNVDGLRPCLTSCKKRYPNACRGVNVVPALTPKGTASFLQGGTPGMHEPNYPGSVPFEWSRTITERNVEPNRRFVEPLHESCANAPTETFDEDTMICYGMFPKQPYVLDPTYNPDTERLYYVRNDPEDPIFYSTCYTLQEPKSFSNGKCDLCEEGQTTTESSPVWDWGGKCVSCETATSPWDVMMPRFWELSNDCEKCF